MSLLKLMLGPIHGESGRDRLISMALAIAVTSLIWVLPAIFGQSDMPESNDLSAYCGVDMDRLERELAREYERDGAYEITAEEFCELNLNWNHSN